MGETVPGAFSFYHLLTLSARCVMCEAFLPPSSNARAPSQEERVRVPEEDRESRARVQAPQAALGQQARADCDQQGSSYGHCPSDRTKAWQDTQTLKPARVCCP